MRVVLLLVIFVAIRASVSTASSNGCSSDSDCATGQHCYRAGQPESQCVQSGLMGATFGGIQQKPTSSNGCSSDSDCATGQHCYRAGQPESQCVQSGLMGATFGGIQQKPASSNGCSSDSDCATGQHCYRAGQPESQCVQSGLMGATFGGIQQKPTNSNGCSSDSDCATGQHCYRAGQPESQCVQSGLMGATFGGVQQSTTTVPQQQPQLSSNCEHVASQVTKGHLIGAYIPQCTKDGKYKDMQCHGSTGSCWCVNTLTGERIDGQEPKRFGNNLDCKNDIRQQAPICNSGWGVILATNASESLLCDHKMEHVNVREWQHLTLVEYSKKFPCPVGQVASCTSEHVYSNETDTKGQACRCDLGPHCTCNNDPAYCKMGNSNQWTNDDWAFCCTQGKMKLRGVAAKCRKYVHLKSCPGLICMIACPNGNLLDSDGCQTCSCRH